MAPDDRAQVVIDKISHSSSNKLVIRGIIAQAIRDAVQAERERCLNLVAQFQDRAECGFPELRIPMMNGGTVLEYSEPDNLPF